MSQGMGVGREKAPSSLPSLCHSPSLGGDHRVLSIDARALKVNVCLGLWAGTLREEPWTSRVISDH